MAGEIFVPKNITIHKELHLMFPVEQQAEYACGTRRGAEQLFHRLAGGERQAGGGDLCRKVFGVEYLISGRINR